MAEGKIRSVAIVGDGPAGATLATLLARRGVQVGLFARGRPAGLLVGESLVPAIIPILRELGVEDEVRAYSVFKPGATFVLRSGEAIGFDFSDAARRLPKYAFNVPRERFDASLIDACCRSELAKNKRGQHQRFWMEGHRLIKTTGDRCCGSILAECA